MINDSEACLTEVERSAPDLVVMDVLLDGPNGFEVCRRLRTRFDASELPILLCAGIFQSPEYACEASAVGAQEYLSSPLEARELVSKVVAHLNGKAATSTSEAGPLDASNPESCGDAIAGGPAYDLRPATP